MSTANQEGREMFTIILWIAGAFVVAGITIGAVKLGGLAFFGPKVEAIRRSISEESRAHVTGTNQNLGRLLRQYDTVSEAHRGGLRELILMEADTMPRENLSPTLRSKIEAIERSY